MLIPDEFKRKITACFGCEGESWLEKLPGRVETQLGDWELTLAGTVHNLSYNYVVKTRDKKGTEVIVKMGLPGFDFDNEARTLREYNGKGCAKLLKMDSGRGAMLLEQLKPGHMLCEEKDEDTAVKIYAKVWKELRRPVPSGGIFPVISDWEKGLEHFKNSSAGQKGLIPLESIELAAACFREVNETSAGPGLLHGDLHHENILFSEDRGWTAIDPKGLSGDPYFDVTSFLINHLHNKENPKELLKRRVDLLCGELDLDRNRFLKAAIAMSTLYACWGIEDSDGEWEKTYQCALWFHEFSEALNR
ncbi:aminoglycoside phosphotransferase family protein [Peribacillus kribbensis]|uniref:aminoglycoside phosphotransferase family protein n=1 Tax=Peribacillus kribbensis TaxID=356658 RepID=UPI000416CB21|nr:aminoglycoside phosphotransferase family protein [Peribacillus kribbensis]